MCMGSSVRYWKCNWGLAGQEMCAEGSGGKMKAKQQRYNLQEANGLWGFWQHLKTDLLLHKSHFKQVANRSQRCSQQEAKEEQECVWLSCMPKWEMLFARMRPGMLAAPRNKKHLWCDASYLLSHWNLHVGGWWKQKNVSSSPAS